MAQTSRSDDASSLLKYLEENGPQVSFYQALLVLERLYPESPLLGYSGPASAERLRIRPSLSLSCPNSDIESISVDRQTRQVAVNATFLGLYGVDTPLPPIFAEYIAHLSSEGEGARVRDFLDIFHHRYYSLLYRSWKKSRPVATGRGLSPLYDRILSAVGFASRLGIGGARLPSLAEARLRVLKTRNISGLASFLMIRLAEPCRVTQALPRAVCLAGDQQSALGQAFSSLGSGLFLGPRVRDRGKICVALHARDIEMWLALAPNGALHRRTAQAIDDYLDRPVDRDIEVTMARKNISAMQLGGSTALGRNAWLAPPREDVCWRWRPRPDAERERNYDSA